MILDKEFVDGYKNKPVPMDALGRFTYTRTYSRDGEDWADTCARVIEGMYELQNLSNPKWDPDKARRSARQAYDMLFNLKWSPPGRGLWMAGTPFVHERGEVEALQNCAFISSKYLDTEKGDFFRWIMEMSMMGVGVGFDTEGKGKVEVKPPKGVAEIYVIDDTRQSWAASLARLVDSYIGGKQRVEFDYSKIRPAGSPIKGFGGVAAGSGPLKKLHADAGKVLLERVGARLTARNITDIANQIGECVIAGNVRRSAEIALGSKDDKEFITLKDYNIVGETRPWSWVSNNSVVVGNEGFEDTLPYISERTYANGEPGFVFIDNIRNYGRMNDRLDKSDDMAMGVNPCAEQTLWHREMCTLAEIYLPRISNKLELAHAIKFAYLYAKSVTNASTQIRDVASRGVMETNRRIGLSLTGIAQWLGAHSERELIEVFEYAYSLADYYDTLYSGWLRVPTSIRRTSIKPSGTVSLLANVTPGIHYPLDRTYIRRVRVSDNSPLIDRLLSAKYSIEPDKYSANTVVVEFPVSLGSVKTLREASLRDQLRLAGLAARYYADNSVSITAQFKRDTDSLEDLQREIVWSRENLKAVSFLPFEDHGYEQAPYESISEEEYRKKVAKLLPLDLSNISSHEMFDAFCDGESCEVPLANA